MEHRYIKVSPEISDYIRTILVLSEGENSQSHRLPLFTGGMPALMVEAGSDPYSLTLYGQSLPETNWSDRHCSGIILYFFKPYTIGTIFNLTAKSLREPVELSQWNLQKAQALNHRLLHAESMAEKIQILNAFILNEIRDNLRACEIIRLATDHLMQNSKTEDLARVIKELNLTERTFQRIFKKYVGISPNEYRRICQFYFAFSQLKEGQFDKLSDLAGDHGYFDQSHYIRSFKEFTGTTPKGYLKSGLGKEEY